ncbi:MAG TPA: Smr/MutS family protein, partial [Candidatus Binatia bacterium]|nr:Smr/MutS family protein [Candidatus Binatia bacterium]
WEGRVVAVDRARRRARLESGGKRVSVDLAELVPSAAPRSPAEGGPGSEGGAIRAGTNRSRLGLERVRRVASSLDLRGARVEEAVAALERYLEDAALAGLAQVTIVHGLGTGALRDAVRATATAHPLVAAVRGGGPNEGGDGVTIVAL